MNNDDRKPCHTEIGQDCEYSLVSVFRTDFPGETIDTNTRFQEVFRYSLAELIGMGDFELVTPTNREKIKQNIVEGKEDSYERTAIIFSLPVERN